MIGAGLFRCIRIGVHIQPVRTLHSVHEVLFAIERLDDKAGFLHFKVKQTVRHTFVASPTAAKYNRHTEDELSTFDTCAPLWEEGLAITFAKTDLGTGIASVHMN